MAFDGKGGWVFRRHPLRLKRYQGPNNPHLTIYANVLGVPGLKDAILVGGTHDNRRVFASEDDGCFRLPILGYVLRDGKTTIEVYSRVSAKSFEYEYSYVGEIPR